MKRLSTLLGLIILLCNPNNLFSQNQDCKVLTPELTGKYIGKCKKGFAHGNGVAEGIDQYDGKFKNGLPDGFGIYTYSNGEIYEGYFSRGKKHGNGKFIIRINGKDSILNGIWKNGEFDKKAIPKSYRIVRSINVNRYTIQRVQDGNRVLFYFTQNGINNNTVSDLQMISDIGTYFELGTKKGYDNITFPVLCKVTYKSLNATRRAVYEVYFELIIEEPGEWLITLSN